MGCAVSTIDDYDDDEKGQMMVQEKRINDLIDKRINTQLQKSNVQFKILLLGAGESGKSTVLKQLKLLHLRGFTDKERVQYAQIIWVDTVQLMKILITQARKLGIKLMCDNPGNTELFQAKQKILRINPLKLIATEDAGGSTFLNDYVIRYGGNQRKSANGGRKVESIGASSPQGFKVETNGDNGEQSNINEDTEDLEFLSKELVKVQNFQREEHSKQVIAEAIKLLWHQDPGISKAFSKRNLFQLELNAQYYFDNVDKFVKPNYRCLDQDILMGRIKTTGITELNFEIKLFKFKVLDAGGQRLERKKWIRCFDGISVILFVVALSEYDQTLFEDNKVNRMHESIMLFDSLCNSPWFVNTPFILFLNKIDVLEEKLKKLPINLYFPQYKGNPTDTNEVVKYFTDIFLKSNRTKKPIYVHTTCATDTHSMKFVLAAVTDVMVQESLQNSGII